MGELFINYNECLCTIHERTDGINGIEISIAEIPNSNIYENHPHKYLTFDLEDFLIEDDDDDEKVDVTKIVETLMNAIGCNNIDHLDFKDELTEVLTDFLGDYQYY